jgi:hypothetical protein
MKEKRSYPRFNTVIEVQDFTNFKTRRTKNLSLGGCLIERCDEFDSLSMVSWLTLKFEIPGVDEAVLASGIVRHTGKHREGFGIQFASVDKKSAYYLERFMGTFL